MRLREFAKGFTSVYLLSCFTSDGGLETSVIGDADYVGRFIVPDFILEHIEDKYERKSPEWFNEIYLLDYRKGEYDNWEAMMPDDMEKDFIEDMECRLVFGESLF